MIPLDKIGEELAPKLAAHSDAIKLNEKLFQRIKGLYESRASLNLNEEDANLLEKYYTDSLNAGAHLSKEQRSELMVLNEQLSRLETQFSKNLLADTNDLAIVVDDVKDLEGLSENEIAACAAAAKSRSLDGKYLIGAVNFSGNPLLASLKNRELRQKVKFFQSIDRLRSQCTHAIACSIGMRPSLNQTHAIAKYSVNVLFVCIESLTSIFCPCSSKYQQFITRAYKLLLISLQTKEYL